MESPKGVQPKIERKKPRQKITSEDTRNLIAPLNLNGIIYMPSPSFDPDTYSRIGKRYGEEPWFKALGLTTKKFQEKIQNLEINGEPNDGDIFFEGRYDPLYLEMPEFQQDELGRRLVDYYIHYKYKHKGKEPEWFSQLHD